MLIACVRKGDKYGPEYVLKLQRMVRRHLPPEAGCTFVCLTDKHIPGVLCENLTEDLPGWWSKLEVFKLGEPTLYFDLDVVITGNLSPVLAWQGFGIVRDWWLPGFNSSVMRLNGDEEYLLRDFRRDLMNRYHMGDQQWITERMPDAKTFPAHWFPSLKANKCFDAPPDDALAIIFHGEPKPCQFLSGWVKDKWN